MKLLNLYLKLALKIYLISILLNCMLITSRKCSIDYFKEQSSQFVRVSDKDYRNLNEEDFKPIRIHIDYSFLDNNVHRLNKTDIKYLKNHIMPKAKEVYEKILSINRVSGNLKLSQYSHCGNYKIPDNYSDGIKADLVVFVNIDTTDFFRKNSIEAAATHCIQDLDTKRPIAGQIIFAPNMRINNDPDIEYFSWLAVHEMNHILAFNTRLFNWFYNRENNSSMNKQDVVGSKIVNDKKIYFVKTPKVLETARKHFNCSNLDGVPLEYNGGEGSSESHWAKKFMNTDYMIADSYGENYISEISLALFEDSGWYNVNYDMANLFYWGKNKGCDFFNKKCGYGGQISEKVNNLLEDSNSIKNENISEGVENFIANFKDEYCEEINHPQCSINNIFRGVCKAKFHKSDLPLHKQYFNHPKFGGNDMFMDRCPIVLEEKYPEYHHPGSCLSGNNQNLHNYEKVCKDCICIVSSIKNEENKQLSPNKEVKLKNFKFKSKEFMANYDKYDVKKNDTLISSLNIKSKLQVPDIKASCYQYECVKGELYIILNGVEKKILCQKEGWIEISEMSLKIKCPDSNKICSEKYKCKFGCTN